MDGERMTTQDQLFERCQQVEEAARTAIDWVSDPQNAETVGLTRKSLLQALRKGKRRAYRLGKAARTKTSVSVFGPSQAGKSFLVSVLARPAEGRLVADFPGEGGKLDYIREINPEGEGESTGLVTRFTMTSTPCPAGFPVRLVLLSEADVARTIVNSFYMDGDQSEPAPEPAEITAQLDRFRARMSPSEVPGMSYEEVLEIGDYVNQSFGKSAYGAALKGFWDEAAAIAPKLPLAERAAFFDLLWGRHQPLTDLYGKLARALAMLEHAEEVHAGLDALVPRERSIIDVKTLHGLFGEGGGTLALHLPSGARAELPRATVCALAAELVLPMESLPSDLFAETDLLDFPGARNRFEQPLSVTLAEPEKSLSQLLLRGKVAYLFDRYVENQEITSMLLCVPDSNMETLDLPGLVDNWIALTHGATPQQRAETSCILFFVLTKFDKHLGDSAAGGGADTRFERRIQASLLEKFGASANAWVEKWTPAQPFQNCYWLRNPNFYVEGLIEYDDDRREVRIRPEKVDRVAELRAGCLSAASVQKHFADPAAAWDAALSLNDGGVGYLIEQLTRVCTPDSKARQIGSQIEKLAADLHVDLQRMHVSDDIEQRIAEKRLAAAEIIDGLEVALASHRFGAVLAELMVEQDAIQDRISRVPSSIRISQAVSAATGGGGAATAASSGGDAAIANGNAIASPPRPGRPLRPGTANAPAPGTNDGAPAPSPSGGIDGARGNGANGADDATRSPANIRTMNVETFQAESSIEVWIEGLNRFRDDAETVASYGLTQTHVANLNAELATAMRRMGIIDRMKARLRDMSFGLTVDKQAEPAAIVCAEHINEFVVTLGSRTLPEDKRPLIELPDGTTRRAYEPRQSYDGADNLPPQPRNAAQDLWTDLVFALDAMFVANAKASGGADVDIEQNLRLGGILTNLEAG